jgi:hypothetical protein
VASGYFIGNVTFGSLPTLVTAGGNMVYADGAMDGFVLVLDSDLVPIWAKRWPESAVGSEEYGSRCLGVDFDSSNNVFGVGYQCGTDSCVGVMSKMAAADGSQVWEKVFTDAQHFERATISNDGSGDFFVRGKLITTDSTVTAANPTPFGVSCAAEDCGVIARMSSDGDLVWARTIEGADFTLSYFAGEVELDATGQPYIYVAMKDAAVSGVVSLDSGTPYAGCKDDTTGVVTPAYEVSTTKMVTASDCPAGSTFVDTDSADAVWAGSANTGVHCDGHSADGCVMKYHAYTGLPIWATTMPNVDAIVTMADGSLHASGDGEAQKFDSKSTPLSTFDFIWHAELDSATGKGLSVQPFGSTTGSGDSQAYDAAVTPGGDLLVAGYTLTTSFGFDDAFTVTFPEENQERNAMLFKVETTGAKGSPSCISSTTTCEIDANSCYIDGLCYADGTTAEVLGIGCVLCDVSKSQTEWSYGASLGVTQCYIDGECKEGNHSGTAAQIPYLRDRGGVVTGTRYAYMYSKCRYCNPAGSITEWSVRDGWQLDLSQQILDECECVAGEGMCDSTGSTTDAGDSTDTTTQTGGGTLSESDGAAGTTVAAGALASLAALLL